MDRNNVLTVSFVNLQNEVCAHLKWRTLRLLLLVLALDDDFDVDVNDFV